MDEYKQTPHDDVAEQAVIGSMLIDDRCIKDVVEYISGSDFYDQRTRTLMKRFITFFLSILTIQYRNHMI